MLAKKLTPLLRQYLDIKQQYNDCLIFFRLGDFYELFFEDAEIAAKTLSITLTKRGQVDGEDIPMCGVPHHHGDSYLAKLLKNGFKVAICEQVETPEESKKRGYKEIIKRKVVRIATPGTLTEEKELISPENNYLMSVTFFNTHFNIVYADISTGEISIKKVLRENEVLDIIESILPSEIILPKFNIALNKFFWKIVPALTLLIFSLFSSSGCPTKVLLIFSLSKYFFSKLNNNNIWSRNFLKFLTLPSLHTHTCGAT